MTNFSVVVIDSKEKNDEIYNFFVRSKLNPTIDSLDVGDIMILGKENFLIERKTETDFIGSLVSGRLFQQMRNLVDDANINNYTPVLLLIGDMWKTWTFRKVKPLQVFGAINTIMFKYGIQVMRCDTETQAAMQLVNLIKMFDPENEKPEKIYPVRTISKKNFTKKDFMRAVMEGLPAISGGRSKKLLDYYGDLNTALEAMRLGKIGEVPGIGKKIAVAVKEIFN